MYTVSVAPAFPAASPRPAASIQGDVALSFTCDPEKAHALIAQAMDEIMRLQVSKVAQLSTYLAMWSYHRLQHR